MTALPGARSLLSPAAAEGGSTVLLRARLFAGCLAGALVLHALASRTGAPFAYLAAACLALGLLVLGLLAGRESILGPGALLAGFAALAWPLFPALEAAGTPADAIGGRAVWPEVLVLLFASRLLAERAEVRLEVAFDGRGGGGTAAPGAQSLGAALFLGAGLALLFYRFFPLDTAASGPAGVLLRALAGPTAVHLAIVLLFFVLLAALLDGAAMLIREARWLGQARREGRTAWSSLPAQSRVRAWLAAPDRPAGEPTPLDEVHAASRRFLRVLLSFLPLLGFLGTVIGLSIAVGALGSRGASPGVDLGGSLAGLAIQFETTLLGLLGGLVGAFALALLDKREAELEAACRRLAASAGAAGDAA
ncbi:MotA/TolQ/ExbB proton channel family protein [Aureimonas leprariae]|uniref:MotA/TolQ/ExbB proton channel domain-containing protein n=1 Tax=Plantimonas leprariae TaxID=2615207 RepID=A0A7V7PL41_9HYPH|nr:MotA/TolQ/ExbB proton channel family protein [Aureimonas leprariae]KAB0676867.1 hypothetical protein F6X38_20060 [Aureimonas leprariae]